MVSLPKSVTPAYDNIIVTDIIYRFTISTLKVKTQAWFTARCKADKILPEI